MINMERNGYERHGFGSRLSEDKNDYGEIGTYPLSARDASLKLLNQVKALREDKPSLFEQVVASCGRWVMLSVYGDEPYNASEAARLRTQLKAMGLDVKTLRELPPPPKPQPKPMDGNKLLYKLKGLKADQPDDFKLVVESHPWLAAKVGLANAFTEDEVVALLATLTELAVDVKALRELKPEVDNATLLYKLRGYSTDNPEGFAQLVELCPWVAEKVLGNDPLDDDEATAALNALAEQDVDVKLLRAVKLHYSKAKSNRHKLVNASLHGIPLQGGVPLDADKPKAQAPAKPKGTGTKRNRWANARFANDRIVLPRRTIPVLVPDATDTSVAAQIFGKVLEFANTKGSGPVFGKLVRRISTSSTPELAVDMARHGAFGGMNSYMAEKELDKRLEGLGEWLAVEVAALLTTLEVDPMDMLRLFTKDDTNAPEPDGTK